MEVSPSDNSCKSSVQNGKECIRFFPYTGLHLDLRSKFSAATRPNTKEVASIEIDMFLDLNFFFIYIEQINLDIFY